MTEPILGARDETPCVCGICSRLAAPVGVIHPPGQNALWLCPLCSVWSALKVSDMNPVKLLELEAKAIDAAAAETIDDVIPAIFEVLWGEGIRDLEAMNGDNYPVILKKIADSADFRAALRKTFLTYGLKIRTDLANLKDA